MRVLQPMSWKYDEREFDVYPCVLSYEHMMVIRSPSGVEPCFPVVFAGRPIVPEGHSKRRWRAAFATAKSLEELLVMSGVENLMQTKFQMLWYHLL